MLRTCWTEYVRSLLILLHEICTNWTLLQWMPMSNEWKIDVIYSLVYSDRIFRNMQCLQPVDPDAQKHQIRQHHELHLQQAIKLFSCDVQQRSYHLLKHVNLFVQYFPHLTIHVVWRHLLLWNKSEYNFHLAFPLVFCDKEKCHFMKF